MGRCRILLQRVRLSLLYPEICFEPIISARLGSFFCLILANHDHAATLHRKRAMSSRMSLSCAFITFSLTLRHRNMMRFLYEILTISAIWTHGSLPRLSDTMQYRLPCLTVSMDLECLKRHRQSGLVKSSHPPSAVQKKSKSPMHLCTMH